MVSRKNETSEVVATGHNIETLVLHSYPTRSKVSYSNAVLNTKTGKLEECGCMIKGINRST